MQALLALGRTVVRHHHVLVNFVLRDLKVKYRGTVLGYLWSLLEPLSLVLIYWFVFVVIARRGGPDYPLVVILGVLPFQFFNTVVASGAASLTANASLIRRVWLPRELFVIGTALSSLVVLGLSLLVCVPFLLLYQVADRTALGRPPGRPALAVGFRHRLGSRPRRPRGHLSRPGVRPPGRAQTRILRFTRHLLDRHGARVYPGLVPSQSTRRLSHRDSKRGDEPTR